MVRLRTPGKIRIVAVASLIAAGLAAAWAVTASAQRADPGAGPGSDETCRSLPDVNARLNCYQQLLGRVGAAAPPPANSVGAWRLIRAANPRGGADAVAMMHTADPVRSDLDFAGMMLRCADNSSTEVVFVVVTPFPPRAAPDITVGAGGRDWRFRASVVPPGAELLLPADAESLALGAWQSSAELNVRISTDQVTINGVVAIDGLKSALATLRSSCPMRK